MKSIFIETTIEIPLDRIVEAVGPEVSRTLMTGYRPPAKHRPPDRTLQVAVDRVVDAFDAVEKVTNTVGERKAREHLDHMIRVLRATSSKLRRKI